MSNTTTADRIILCVAAFLLLLFSYFLYDDSLLFPKRDDAGLEQIGQVDMSSNDVRIKTATAFTWLPMQKSDTVHLHDSIFTGDRSHAVIRLKDGTQLQLTENSLVSLNQRDGQMSLDLRYGDLSSKLSSNAAPIKINSGGKIFELSGQGSVRIKRQSNGELGVTVTEGSAKLKGPQGTVQTIAPGRDLKVSDKGGVEDVTPPVITTPAEKALVTGTFRTLNPEEKRPAAAHLSWSSEKSFPRYQYEIASDAEFKTLVHKAETKNLAVETPRFNNGTYNYRVRGVFKNGRKSSWSTPARFQINVTSQLILPPAAPVMSQAVYDFNPTEQKKRTPAAVPKPVVAWSPVENAKSYKVQFSRSPEFTKARSYNVDADNIAWPDYQPGNWHVRVAAVSAEGLVSPPSDVSKLNIALSGPVLNPFNKLTVNGEVPLDQAPPAELKAQWVPVPDAPKYMVQMDSSPDFKNPQVFQVEGTADSLRLPVAKPGEYHVRLRAMDTAGRPISPYSNPEVAVYEYRNPLRTPALVEPFDQASIFLQTTVEPYIWLEWKKIKDAGRYEVELALDPDFKRRLLAEKVEENRFLLKQQIPVGQFYWRVRALTADGSNSSDWAAPRQFRIFSQKNEAFSR